MNDELTVMMLSREVVRMLSCFRTTPVLTISSIEILNVNKEKLVIVSHTKTIPEKHLKRSLDDIAELYLLSSAYHLSIGLSKHNPTHTFLLPLVENSAIVNYDGISLRSSKKENDYKFEVCCNLIMGQ